MKTLKCVVIGDGVVGKTSLLITYVENQFPKNLTPDIFDNYKVPVNINGEHCTLDLFSVAGQEDYDILRRLSFPETYIFLVCYSVVNPSSFGNVKLKWLPEIDHHAAGVPFIIVGTQTDLREDPLTTKNLDDRMEKVISFSQGQKLAKETKAVCYMECSALKQFGVKNVFDEAVNVAWNRKFEKHSKKRCLLL